MILIIPTAGLATRMQPLSYGIPKVLVVHHDKPLIDYILQSYQHVSLKKVILVIAPGQRELFEPILAAYELQYCIELVEQSSPLGLLDATFSALSSIGYQEPVIVHLADAIFEQPFQQTDFEHSFVTLTQVLADQVGHWCMVDVCQGVASAFDDKPKQSKWRSAITGVYYFSNPQVLKDAVRGVMSDQQARGKGNISVLLAEYVRSSPLKAFYRDDWHDMGTLQHMHQHVFQHYLDGHAVQQKGQQIVKSGDSLAMKNELFYYQFCLVPECFPRIQKLGQNQIAMDYIPARSLASYLLWQPLATDSIEYINASFWQWIEEHFYHHLPPVPGGYYLAETAIMYGERIIDRVESWRLKLSDQDQQDLFGDIIKVNGQLLQGWGQLRDQVRLRSQDLAKTAVIRHIHGDLHCANILYSPEPHLFTLLDPRGAWGNEQSIWGDIRYDAAKFLHSFHGSYEYIKNRLSHYEQLSDKSYILQFPLARVKEAQWLDHFCSRWRVKQKDILWIEALCLLSISKFYQDLTLQKQFFLQGLILLNSLL